jgi:hypothetical protein
MAADEIGVDVGLYDPFHREPLLVSLVEVDADVTPRVDDDRASGGLIGDQVRGVREASEVVLGEDHLNHLMSCPGL